MGHWWRCRVAITCQLVFSARHVPWYHLLQLLRGIYSFPVVELNRWKITLWDFITSYIRDVCSLFFFRDEIVECVLRHMFRVRQHERRRNHHPFVVSVCVVSFAKSG